MANMRDFSLLDLYAIGRDAVRLFPDNPERKCLQVQTFRVLQVSDDVDLGAPNLGAVPSDKDNPFFWSRKWMQARYDANRLSFDYPIFTMYQESNKVNNFFGGSFVRSYTFRLSVVDLYREECTTGKVRGCDSRTINQIYIDTGILLDSVLQYFRKMVIATTDTDPEPRVYFLPYLEYLRNELKIRSFDVIKSMADNLSGDNLQTEFVPVDYPGKIHGTFCKVVFRTTECARIDYKCDLDEYGVRGFEALHGAPAT